jgi:hypothetical protein
MSDNIVVCSKCQRELNNPAPPSRMATEKADAITISHLLLCLRQFTYTPMQAEHLMVMLRGQTR